MSEYSGSDKEDLHKASYRSSNRNRARTVYSYFKRFLVSEACPVDFTLFFEVVGYQTKHRTFMDFELPFLYVESIDKKIPGVLDKFRQYMSERKKQLIVMLEKTYGKPKLKYYMVCVNRIYKAYNSGESTLCRLRMLYDGYKTKGLSAQMDSIWKRLAEKIALYI